MNELWTEWLALHRLLVDAQTCHFRDLEISAPFMSSDSGSHDAPHRLLFVGQATSKGWYDKEFTKERARDAPPESIISERQQRNRGGICEEFWGRGFWLTFRAISRKLGNEPGEYSNALWTNIAKIGVSPGNPQELVLSIQADLAARTLRAEIQAYRPSVVVFATGKYGSSIVLSATATTSRDWRKSEDRPEIGLIDKDMWWIPRSHDSRMPAYLWTMHPSRGISTARRNFWVEAALQLSQGDADIGVPV